MSAPSARVGKNRRRAFLCILMIVGAALFLSAFPTFNSAYLLGLIFLTAGAAGFVLLTGTQR